MRTSLLAIALYAAACAPPDRFLVKGPAKVSRGPGRLVPPLEVEIGEGGEVEYNGPGTIARPPAAPPSSAAPAGEGGAGE